MLLLLWKHSEGKAWGCILSPGPYHYFLDEFHYGLSWTWNCFWGKPVLGRSIFQEPHHLISPLALSALTTEILGPGMTVRPPPCFHHSFQHPTRRTPILSYCSPTLARSWGWVSSLKSTPLFCIMAPSGGSALLWLPLPLKWPGPI